MIEKCENILECENKLGRMTQTIKLLGETPLSIEEVDKLGSFIKNQVSGDIQKGTEFFRYQRRASLRYFYPYTWNDS